MGRLGACSSPDEARAAYPNVLVERFPNGEWMFGVCDDSHAPWVGAEALVRELPRLGSGGCAQRCHGVQVAAIFPIHAVSLSHSAFQPSALPSQGGRTGRQQLTQRLPPHWPAR
jgi:hypothetical protein